MNINYVNTKKPIKLKNKGLQFVTTSLLLVWIINKLMIFFVRKRI